MGKDKLGITAMLDAAFDVAEKRGLVTGYRLGVRETTTAIAASLRRVGTMCETPLAEHILNSVADELERSIKETYGES